MGNYFGRDGSQWEDKRRGVLGDLTVGSQRAIDPQMTMNLLDIAGNTGREVEEHENSA